MIETIKYGQDPRPGLILPPWFPQRKHAKRHPARKQEGVLWVPQKGEIRVEHNTGSVGAATPGTSVTTGAASGTKGTPAEIFASTSFDAYWITIWAAEYSLSATASQGCMDILIGAATEEVLIPNLLHGHASQYTQGAWVFGKVWEFPLYIPAGSRIAVQAAGARTSTAFRVGCYLYGGNGLPPYRLGGKVTTYGISAVPDGTTVTPGASGAEGAWAQMTASSSEDHFAFVPSFQASADTNMGVKMIAVDLGIGSATEEMIAEGYWFATDGGERMQGPIPSMPCFKDVPSGTRLVMRASNSTTNDAYNGAIHAVS